MIPFLCLLLLSGCYTLRTPFELTSPPSVQAENFQLKEQLDRLLPVNATLLQYQSKMIGSGNDAITIKDLNGDGEVEAAILYENKMNQRLGILFLTHVSEQWEAQFHYEFEASKIQDYYFEDLDGDAVYELILGLKNNDSSDMTLTIYQLADRTLHSIYTSPYTDMSFGDLMDNGHMEIAVAHASEQPLSNKIGILCYQDGSMQRLHEKFYPVSLQPYHVLIGKADEDRSAVFVDMYVNDMFGTSDVLAYQDAQWQSIVNTKDTNQTFQQQPVVSEDINGDNLIEIASTSTPKFQDSGVLEANRVLITNYYRIRNDGSLQKIVQIYRDPYGINLSFRLPAEFTNRNFTMTKEKNGTVLTLSYAPTDVNTQIYPLMKIEKIMKDKSSEYSDYILLKESDNYLTMGLLMPPPQELSGAGLDEFHKLRDKLKDMEALLVQ